MRTQVALLAFSSPVVLAVLSLGTLLAILIAALEPEERQVTPTG